MSVNILDTLPEKRDQIRAARELLDNEQAEVRKTFAKLRQKGARLAAEQQEWRDAAAQMLERGAAAGLSVAEMARELGLSRQWTTHIRQDSERRQKLGELILNRELPPWLKPKGRS
jgi:hypothetical protein